MAKKSSTDEPIATNDPMDKHEQYEGTHPARSISEAANAAPNAEYAENPDKPDPTTVAQVEVVDKAA